MRLLLGLFLTLTLAVAVAADVPWGDEEVVRAGGHRNLAGGVVLRVVGVGEGATVSLGPTSRRIRPGETAVAGSYRVYLVGIQEDRCTLKWVRAPRADQAVDLLQGYGWERRDSGPPQQSTLDLPADLGGPAAEYQALSRRLGLDLRPAAGKKVFLRRYRLREVASNAAELYGCVLISPEGLVVGAWLSPEGAGGGSLSALDQRALLQW